ncbi:major facilitator superfamily domain-containing protein 8-like [Clytia hemisphaerica]|uniref:major facilitator superfamily domain-containing protein 8-like n=1 Tax=Clytia hemisphaerica TaxID=252671 RepID=UPI0034D5EA4E
MSKISMKEWLKRRSRTTKIFYLTNLALGIEYSLTFATLYVYLKDVLHVADENLNSFYSAISGLYVFVQILSSLILSKVFEQNRRLRLMFFIINVLTIIGNVLYTIPSSPYMLLAGRFISGAGGAIQPIMMSELAKSYSPDELIDKLSPMALSLALGLTLGPSINFAFVHADFWFFGVHIVFANGSGLVLTFLFLMLLFISIFFVSDLSREYDLRDSTTNLKENSENLDIMKTTKALLTNIDIVLIFLFSFNLFLAYVTFDCWIPMVVVDVLQWEPREINSVLTGSGVVLILVFLYISYKSPGKERLFQYTLLAFTDTLAEMVPSTMQAYSESVRIACSRTGAVVGLFTAAFTFRYLYKYCLLCIIFNTLLFSIFISRGKFFKEPSSIFLEITYAEIL